MGAQEVAVKATFPLARRICPAHGGLNYFNGISGDEARAKLLIAVAGQSRVLVRRKLTARVFVGAAASYQHAGDAARSPLGDDGDAGSLWLLRRLVLAEVAIAIVVLAVTALLGIATPPRAL